LASIVISASSATAKRSRTWARSARRSADDIVVGVPPPRKTLAKVVPSHPGAARDASSSNARR
jgi:hypothetical protein